MDTSATIQRLFFCLLTLSCMGVCEGAAKILLYPYGNCRNSHLLHMERLGGLLVSDGYDVSMLINNKYNQPMGDLDLSTITLQQWKGPDDIPVICDFNGIHRIIETSMNEVISTFMNAALTYCDSLLADRALLDRLKAEKYDLFLYDYMDMCGPIIASYLDIPTIQFLSQGLGGLADMDWPSPMSYLPSVVSDYTDHMNLFQRTVNTVSQIFMRTIFEWTVYPKFQALREKYDLNSSMTFQESLSTYSLRFVFADFALDYPRPTMPDLVFIGSYFAKSDKPLGHELEDYMDNADVYGAIVFSLGSFAKDYTMEWGNKFAKALARLPQKVVWRYNGPTPTELGNNTLLLKWLPQTALLGHKNTKLFITHCGLGGTYEAAFFGVPVVAMPLLADQHHQASKLTNHAQMGVQLNIKSLTSDDFYNAIKKVIEDRRYERNAQAVSQRFIDQPVKTKDNILFWVHYVLKHNGAYHLKSQGYFLPWYQYYCLDVAIVVLSFLALLVTVLRLLLRTIWKYLGKVNFCVALLKHLDLSSWHTC